MKKIETTLGLTAAFAALLTVQAAATASPLPLTDEHPNEQPLDPAEASDEQSSVAIAVVQVETDAQIAQPEQMEQTLAERSVPSARPVVTADVGADSTPVNQVAESAVEAANQPNTASNTVDTVVAVEENEAEDGNRDRNSAVTVVSVTEVPAAIVVPTESTSHSNRQADSPESSDQADSNQPVTIPTPITSLPNYGTNQPSNPSTTNPSTISRSTTNPLTTSPSTINPSTTNQPITIASEPTNEELQQRLQELESQQQELEQELQNLRQQINDPANRPSVTQTDPNTETAINRSVDRPQSIEISTEVLFLEPNTSQPQDFAIVDPGTALFAGGEVVAPEYDRDTAIRIGANYHLPDSRVDIGVTHTTLSSSGSLAVERDPNGFLLSTLAAPVQNENADTASSEIDLNHAVTDVEVGYAVTDSDRLDARLFGGLRFADIHQDNVVRYDGRDFTNTEIQIARDFTGYGLRAGGEAHLNFGGDVSLFGRAAGSLLVGNFDSRLQETDNNGADLIVALERSADERVVPVVEVAAGLQWQPSIGDNANLTFAAGYELQNWFNVADTTRFVDNSGTGVITQDEGDLSLEGFFVRLGVEFAF
ncbi:MAG: Lpg1974 family pore-forming outer membrane protein [Thainema sp.]